MANLLIILAGALIQLWPAILNNYPLVFSDTGGFLEQALMPDMGWDKPWIYGPFLTPFHAGQTLWLAVAAQATLLSAMLWITQAILGPPSRRTHLILSALLAVGTAAPWFASLVMPDILAPVCVLGLFALAYAPGRLGTGAQAWVALATTIAIASHLAHLILAAACIALLCLLRWRLLWRAAAPLAAALALLLATNLAGHGTLAISPYGSVFALARLIGDGPARTYIDTACPDAAYRLCAWKGRLPTDSDEFLWHPNGPVWADGYGPIRIAPEAAALVRATIAAQPAAVLAAALRNTARQLALTRVGDALTPEHLDIAVLPRIQAYFPQAETDRFTKARQFNATLQPALDRLTPHLEPILVLCAAATTLLTLTRRRTQPRLAALAALILVALLANAASTGALSGPHHRYQARIAWLLAIPPILAWPRRTRAQALTPDAKPPQPAATAENSAR